MFFLYLSDIFLNFTNKNNSASKKVSGFSKDQYSSRNLKEEIKAEKSLNVKKYRLLQI
jgi:hypothetical protein